MKRQFTVFISVLLVLFLVTGCGSSGSSGGEQTESQPEEQVVETHYTDNQTEMGNYMNDAYAYLANGWVYTIGWGADTSNPLFLKMRTDGSDDTVLHYSEGPEYINVKGEYIYAVLIYDATPNIYRFRLGGDDEKKIVEGATYLSIKGDKMYYCKTEDGNRISSFNACDLDGSNEEVIYDKEIYYPYIEDDLLFYQDDADNETIHCYNLSTKEDKRITDRRTYQYVLNDDYMYCIQYDGARGDENDKGKLVKINLETLEREVLYEGALDESLAVKDDRLFFVNQNDDCRIYSIDKNGDNISLVAQDSYCWGPCIYEDKMIYCDAADNYEYVDDIFICNLDGSNKISLRKEY